MKAFFGKIKVFIKPVILLILLLTPMMVIHQLRAKDTYGTVYENWAAGKRYSHISALLSEKCEFGVNDVLRFRSELEKKLEADNALEGKSGNKLWIDCYSAKGTVQVETGISPTEFTAYGVGGDFFKFHPFRLLEGSFFSKDNVMKDLIVIDEDLAWQLFGSADIAGMKVMINGDAFIVSGVIRRDTGIFNNTAGNGKTAIYMSYDAFVKYNNVPITDYEIIMPDLTKDYAYKLVKDGIGANGDFEIEKVSGRLSYTNFITVIQHFGQSSMQKKAIAYPYWENKSRAIAQICGVAFLIFMIELVLVIIYILVKAIMYYLNNKEMISEKMAIVKSMMAQILHKLKNKIMGRKINTVILDIGMVLAEFIPEEHFRNIGITEEKIAAVMDAVVENEIWEEYDGGILTYEETLKKMIERRPQLEKEIKKAFKDLSGIVRRYEYTDELIKGLKSEGYKVLYLSNLSEKLYHDCEKELDFIKDMDGGILSFEAKMKKPDKDIYELIIRKYNLVPERCVFFDDREANLRAAGELGMKTIVFEGYGVAQHTYDGRDYGDNYHDYLDNYSDSAGDDRNDYGDIISNQSAADDNEKDKMVSDKVSKMVSGMISRIKRL